MLQIIPSFNTSKILKYNTNDNDLFAFILLDSEFQKDSEILRLKGLKEIKIEEMNDKERIQCEKEYINTIASLGFSFNSMEWWAKGISEKNEHVSYHYRNLCLFYSLVKTLKNYADTQMRIFIICNSEILEQLIVYCKKNQLDIVSLEKPIVILLQKLYKRFYAILKIRMYLLATLFKKMCITFILKARIRKEINNNDNYYVIRTWLDNRFLAGAGNYHDAYFGRLPEYAVEHGHKVLIIAGIVNSYLKVIRNIKSTKDILIIPEEYFLKYGDLFRSFFSPHYPKLRISKNILFNYLDVKAICENEMIKDFYTVNYIKNIFRYLIAKRFAQTITFKTYIQTFENYAWEKMSICGIKEVKPTAKIYGFQHTYVTRNSFKYFPGKMEKDILPLPDRIITMGKVTKDIIGKYGCYNPNILSIGCALRQEYVCKLKPFKRRRFNKVVVPLTMVSSESVLIMECLYDSGLPKTEIQVVVRCHPSANIESFKKKIDFEIPSNFIISNEKSLKEELSDTDMVLYTWSTVAVEALKMGLPVIYLDILSPMYVDPLFECNGLKKSVRKVEGLITAIESFHNMDDDVFYKEQELSQRYLEDFFYPVNNKNLRPFFYDN